MNKHGLAPIPADGRLTLAVRRAAEHARNATLIAKLAPDTEPHFKRPQRYIEPADTRTLRGIPAIGRGVAGAIPRTSPHAAIDRLAT